MPNNKFKRILVILTWCLVIGGGAVLSVAAVRNNNSRKCKGLKISISGTDDKLFIDENEIKRVIFQFAGSELNGRPVSEFDLHGIEQSLKKDIWIRDAKLYFDNNEIFRISVVQREPVARIFSRTGYSFYIDSSLTMLPLSDLFSARVPVFTGFPVDQKVLRHRDSMLLEDIRDLSLQMYRDPVIGAMIEQVEITPSYEFELIPKLGNQVIAFGDASDAGEKFSRMLVFYKELIAKGRLNRYSRISLKFKGQVVATVKGMESQTADSVSITQMINLMAARAEKMASDTTSRMLPDNDRGATDVSMIQQSVERDEPGAAASTESASTAPAKPVPAPAPAPAPVTKPAKPAAPAVKKPAAAKPVVPAKPAVPSVKKPASPAPVKKTTAPAKKETKPAKPAAVNKSPAKATMPANKTTKTNKTKN